MRVVRILGSLAIMGLCACTHLVQEQAQQVHVSSDPDKAAVYVGDVRQPGITPMAITVDPRRTHALRVEKDCYAAYTMTLRPSMGGRTYGTVIIPVSQLEPSVHVQLQPTCAPLVKKEGR